MKQEYNVYCDLTIVSDDPARVMREVSEEIIGQIRRDKLSEWSGQVNSDDVMGRIEVALIASNEMNRELH